MGYKIPDWVQKEADGTEVKQIDAMKAESVLARLQVLQRERRIFAYLEDLQSAAARYVLHSEPPPEKLGISSYEMGDFLADAESDIRRATEKFWGNLIEHMVATKRYEVGKFQEFIEKRLIEYGNPNNQTGEWRADTLSDAVFRFTRAYANKFGRPLFSIAGGLNTVGDPNIDQTETPLADIIKPPIARPPDDLPEKVQGADGKTYLVSGWGNPDYDYEYYQSVPQSGGLNDAEQKIFQTASRNFYFGAADNFKGRMERLEGFTRKHLLAQLPSGLAEEECQKSVAEISEKAKRVVEREWAIQTKFDGEISTFDTPDIVLHKQLMPKFEEQEKRRATFLKFVDDKIPAHTNEFVRDIDQTTVMETDVKRISEIAMENRNSVMRLYDHPLQIGEAGGRKHNWEIFKSIFEEYNALHPDTPAPVAQQEQPAPAQKSAVDRLASRSKGGWLDSFRIGGA